MTVRFKFRRGYVGEDEFICAWEEETGRNGDDQTSEVAPEVWTQCDFESS